MMPRMENLPRPITKMAIVVLDQDEGHPRPGRQGAQQLDADLQAVGRGADGGHREGAGLT